MAGWYRGFQLTNQLLSSSTHNCVGFVANEVSAFKQYRAHVMYVSHCHIAKQINLYSCLLLPRSAIVEVTIRRPQGSKKICGENAPYWAILAALLNALWRSCGQYSIRNASWCKKVTKNKKQETDLNHAINLASKASAIHTQQCVPCCTCCCSYCCCSYCCCSYCCCSYCCCSPSSSRPSSFCSCWCCQSCFLLALPVLFFSCLPRNLLFMFFPLLPSFSSFFFFSDFSVFFASLMLFFLLLLVY